MNRNIERRARTPLIIDPTDPHAVGVCDYCSFWVLHKDLKKALEYRGGSVPVWNGMLVCTKCYDIPNPAPQFKRMALPPDPVPVQNPRVEQTVNSGYGYWVTEDGDYVNTVPDEDTWGGEYVVTIPNQGYL